MSKNDQIQTSFDRCSCCLNYNYTKRMWLRHLCNDVVEIYGEMLARCFALSFHFSENSMKEDKICEPCIVKLREATKFKKAILNAQEELMKIKHKGEEYLVKIEKPTDHCETVVPHILPCTQVDTIKHLKTEQEDKVYIELEKMEFLEEESNKPVIVKEIDKELVNVDNNLVKVENSLDHCETADPLLMPYKQLDVNEYTEAEENTQKINFKEVDYKSVVKETVLTSQYPMLKSKSVEKSKEILNKLQYKIYKQYSIEDLTKSVEAICPKKLSLQEASDMYNVPKRMIELKLKTHNYLKVTESGSSTQDRDEVVIEVDVEHLHYSIQNRKTARPKTAAERMREYRARKRNKTLSARDPSSINQKRPKTVAERSREYRARKRNKILSARDPSPINQKCPKTVAERSREYRARKKNKILSAGDGS